MSSQPIREVIRTLRETLRLMEPHENSKPVPPEVDRLYLTFNGSVVFIYKIDSDGDGRALVLKGGHGTGSSGGCAGDSYFVKEDGYFKAESISIEMGMSLLKPLPVNLSDFTAKRLEDLELEQMLQGCEEDQQPEAKGHGKPGSEM